MTQSRWYLDPGRFFDPDPAQRRAAQQLYASVADLPLICPHGHVDPRLFVDNDATFGTPTELLIIPDHYIFRMLYSQGIALESLGMPRTDGGPVEQDHCKIWQVFAENFYLFRSTPSGIWLTNELYEVFGIEEKLTGETAQSIYDQIAEKLASPEPEERARAAAGLGAPDTPRALAFPALVERMSDPAQTVRLAAARALIALEKTR